jgi:hypothetical protein
MSDGSIPVGDIRFYDSYRPLLDAGDYTIDIQQQIDSTDTNHPLSEAAPEVLQKFSVIAPRFALDPSEVQSVFPPANASGPFDLNLPHIVLMQRALPWERELGENLPAHSNPNVKAYPWIALLLFTEDEILSPPGAPVTTALANPTKVGTYPVDEVRNPTDTTILGSGANVAAQLEDEPAGRAIDITTDVFTRVTPRLAELPFLSHARQVNVDNKTTSLALTSGWFSVVVSNRFPLVPQNSKNQRWIAHLVSLEGFADYLVDQPNWSGKTAVRLPSLVSWSFTSEALGADFSKLMENLVAGQATGGDGLRLCLRPPPPNGAVNPDSGEDLARKALSQGYAPLQYETRVGDQTFAWYHGPFVPHPVPPISAGTAFESGAAATIYNSETGTFDLSYAAGWELGRMLALSDRAYTTNQQRARKAVRKLVNLVRERTSWQAGSEILAARAKGSIKELLHPRHVSRSVGSWMATEAAKHLPRPDRAPVAAPPVNGRRAKRAPAVADLRALHEHGAIQAQVQAHIEEALNDGPVDDMAAWLGRLRLLEGIPFVHLVPDARMLPVESIRFFYVDPNMLDALCDGAQTVGLQNSRDALQHDLVRPSLRAAAIGRAQSRRALLIGRNLVADDVTPSDPVAGFLLRSAVVSGWPGLEIKAFTDFAGTDPITPLRIDHIASDVLIALYPQVPARVDIEEPKEGLVFGVELDDGQWEIGVRNITDPDIGKVIDKLALGKDGIRKDGTSFLRDGGVLQVDALQLELSKKFPNSADVWGPAAYALQMVDAPQRMTFDNSATP